MNKLVDVKIEITKSGFIWNSPTVVKVHNVPPEKYEKLIEFAWKWSKELTEPKK